MKLKIGQSVKVKKGILCPDDPEFDICGWQGRISEINEETVGITWDSVTLHEMPELYIEKSEDDGLDWTTIYLSFDDVESAEPRDSKSDVDKIQDSLEDRFMWTGMGEEGKRIQTVVNSAKSNSEIDILDAWEKHLKEYLKFPFEAFVDEFQSRGPINQGDKLKIHDIEMSDDLYGIIVKCRKGRKQYHFPLVDLAAIDKKSDNARNIKDYRTWFSNR
ncbi:calcium-binding protein [Desulfonema limicola]|uniref:calcium-binding protein n=1 Tax=Desulfonema limicola TaxID=45656 RepID=UPI001A9B2F11|nr:calcium-binding protein [Desulfonema limicola]